MSMLGLSFLALVVSVAGHSCHNGARVSCVAVQTLEADSTSSSHGKGARGTPHCTTEGNSKVYCLVDHSYHRCQTGYAACCADGSNPWHYSEGSKPDDAFTCSKAMDQWGEMVAASTPPPRWRVVGVSAIVLDDMDVTGTQGVLAHEGSYRPCMNDAYQNQFHHDWAENKGKASFSFTFDAPASGCYKIEEYHPGNDPMCAQYMPRNAQLDVVHSYDKQKSTYSINQAIKPAQWNEVGSHMFMSDTPGKLIMRNTKEEKCDAGGCFWIADAFRMKWTGEKCAEMTGAAVASSEAMSSKPMETPAEVAAQLNGLQPEHKGCKKTYQGTARLNLHFAHETNDAGEHQHVDVAMTVNKHKIIFQTVFAKHFNLQDVKIVDIVLAGRRLAGLSAVNVNFQGKGTRDSVNLGNEGLTNALSKALSDAKAGFTISGSSVMWAQPADDDSSFLSGTPLIAVLFGVGVVSFLVIAVAAYFAVAWKRSKRASDAGVIQPTLVAVGKAVDVVPVEADSKESKDKLDNCEVISNGSTRSPDSDQPRSEEDTNSNEDKITMTEV